MSRLFPQKRETPQKQFAILEIYSCNIQSEHSMSRADDAVSCVTPGDIPPAGSEAVRAPLPSLPLFLGT